MTGRFARTRLLLGAEGLRLLAQARVAVVGLGAVGSYAVEGLTRAGVGHLRLVDFDRVRASNVNRQLYALESTLGRLKTEVAAERVRDINPDCEIEVMTVFVDGETATSVLTPPPDLVIDAIDSVGPKVELIATAVAAGVKAIACMGAASRTDPARVRVADLAETRNCPLARFVRRRLARRGIRSGVVCVYSEEPARGGSDPAGPDEDARLEEMEETLRRGRRRRPIGSLSTLTGIFGLTAATEAIRRLASPGAGERGFLA